VPPPGRLAGLCGCLGEEFGRLEPGEFEMVIGDEAVPPGTWYEALALDGAGAAAAWKVPAEYGPCAARGDAAVSLHEVGKGAAIYVGTFLTEQNVGAILRLARQRVLVEPLAAAAENVEVVRRRSPDRSLLFVLNHYPVEQEVGGLTAGVELLSGRRCDGELRLDAYGVAVIEED
jgi:beta-galactosidase